MLKTYKNILETIGNTPIVKINKITKGSEHTFWGKIEYMNPGGSIKDRLAIAIIEQAEKRGQLKPGGTIVEATAGNTGLGLAMVAAVKGYKCIFVMPDKMSEEKRASLRAYGAKVIVTPTNVEVDDPNHYIAVSKKIAKETPDSFYSNQYHNPDNAEQHYLTTGPEIWNQMGVELDFFVGGAGTGGTVSGVGRYLKEKNPNVKVILADPVGSILSDLFYYKEVRTPPASYKVEGVGEDMLPDNVHFKYMDDVVQISDQQSFPMTRRIISEEGISVGPSSAMALCAAIEYSKRVKKPSNFLVLFPDNGRAYLSKAYNDQWMKENGFI